MFGAYGLYSHIQANRWRSVALLLGLFFLIYVMVFAGALFAEAWLDTTPTQAVIEAARRDFRLAWPWATLASALWVIIAYFYHQSMIGALTGGQVVTREGAPRLYNLLENLCIARGLKMPVLKIMPSAARNAFATGMNERQYAVTVTTGLVEALDDAEFEAVLAHELTHVRNGDVRMLVVAVVIAGVISFFAELFFRIFFRTGGSVRKSDDRKGGGAVILLALALIAVAWLLSLVLRLALSRSREFLADAGAVELTKNPDAMISALRKIENRGELEGATSAVMEMCVDNPRSGFADLFATHPSIDHRVMALVRFAGGRDPGTLAPTAPATAAAVEGKSE